jgi:hypothetical protein
MVIITRKFAKKPLVIWSTYVYGVDRIIEK